MGGAFWTVLALIVLLGLIGTIYLWFLIRHSRKTKLAEYPDGLTLLTVLGSGGHTPEMLAILRHLDEDKYKERVYVIADTDSLSESKALEAEQNRASGAFSLVRISRSREVGQSYISSIFTTILAFFSAFPIVFRVRPSLVMVNGPGTCIPVCIAAALLDMIRVTDTRIIYVESICRVEKLSLSATILYYSGLADDVIVQWPQLKDIYQRVVSIEDL